MTQTLKQMGEGMGNTLERNTVTLTTGNRIKRVVAQLSTMRKPQEFIVYPYKLGQDTLYVQSDKAVGAFNIVTGKGRLNYRCKGHNAFVQLQMDGAIDFQFPSDFVMAALEAQPGSGDRIGACVYIA